MDYCQIVATIRGTISYRLRQIFNYHKIDYSVKVVRQSDGRKVEFSTIIPSQNKEEVLSLIKESSLDPAITVLPVLEYENPREYQQVRDIDLASKASVSSMAELYDGVSIGSFSRVVGNAILQEEVSIGEGTFIGSGVVVRGQTEIGDNCHIGTGAIIGNNVKIGDNVTIEENVTIRANVNIGNDVSIGTAANIESNVDIKDNIRIGPMARIFNVGRKKATLESAEDRLVISTVINSGSFIGSGAIVGGKIGSKVMIGSNSVVHTATIGDEATVGSGSTVPYGREVAPKVTVIGSPAKPVDEYKAEKKLLKFLQTKYNEQLKIDS
ncbi:DapH/DapD/GlmU-related protein [Halonatronum saccharophilum]|uniref:DapH/DapD/GlmU-related protein n=1 Tax=Halonatronum saccharophilum TaxID=150060 RepID=UPI0004870A49|nr:DapH/DapD/GlmU-related protein [Halonatronum saccharophilum]